MAIDTLRALYLRHFEYAAKRVAGRARKKGNEMGVKNDGVQDIFKNYGFPLLLTEENRL